MIYEKTTIAIAIVSDTEIKVVFADKRFELFEMGGAAVFVDKAAIRGVGADKFDFGAEGFEDLFVDDRGGAVGAVEANFEIGKTDVAEIITEMFSVEGEGVGMQAGAIGRGNEGVGMVGN